MCSYRILFFGELQFKGEGTMTDIKQSYIITVRLEELDKEEESRSLVYFFVADVSDGNDNNNNNASPQRDLYSRTVDLRDFIRRHPTESSTNQPSAC